MTTFKVKGILLDVEGTTSSVRFVYDVLFPYARDNLRAFLENAWLKKDARAACDQIAKDAGAASLADWTGRAGKTKKQQTVIDEVHRLMDGDVKATGLKQLQGLIWRDGFKSGQLCSHVYRDVVPALKRWKKAGRDIRIYSSGSVTAQKLFFAHTERGDLSEYLNGHYDTTTGPKKKKSSYKAIAKDMLQPPSQILFISDVVDELDAAAAAGMKTVLSLRPQNAPVPAGHKHMSVRSFAEIGLNC